MSGIRIAATVVYIIVCLVLVFLVFKGKGQGSTAILAAIFIVLSLVMNMSWGY